MPFNFETLREALRALKEWEKVADILASDMEAFNRHPIKPGEAGFWSRTLVRHVFAQQEAETFQISRILLALHHASVISLSEADLSVLRGDSYRVNDKGSVDRQALKVRASDHLIFIMRVCSEHFPEIKPIDKGSTQWSDYRKALAVRDRITHPKAAGDLEVGREDFLAVSRTMDWLPTLTSKFPQAITRAVEDARPKPGSD